MCGIAGVWGHGNVRAMTKLLTHRGPDSDGFLDSDPMHLGMRRLAVIDLTTGNQPIFNETRTVAVVFNGEIFNYLELRAQLRQRGHVFQTQTDTEVIVHAYEEYGLDCVQQFNGMFAFALWDETKQHLFLARDRLGEKPLYYSRETREGGRFLFASEIKSLLEEIPAEPALDDEFWVLETTVGAKTMFRGIHALPPAHALLYQGDKIKIWPFWKIPNEEQDEREPGWSAAECATQLRGLIEDAVKIRLRSDVPVGAFLSGGLDSSFLCCLAKPQHVFVCNIAMGPAYDELRYAQIVADHIGAEMHVVQPTAADLQHRLPKILWHLDQPLATMSPLGEFMLAERARQHVTVALGGQGADELFGGYTRYFLMLEEARLGRSPQPEEYSHHPLVREYLPLARFFWTPTGHRDPSDRYLDLLQRGAPTCDEVPQLMRHLFLQQKSLINQMGMADLHLNFPSLITMNDRAAAAVGLENRTPFLDHRIVEFAFRMPSAYKIRDNTTKWILHEAARGLVPEEILNRKDKKGLVIPATHWLQNELKDWSDVFLKRQARRGIAQRPAQISRGEFDRTRYGQVCLELWWELFVERSLTL